MKPNILDRRWKYIPSAETDIRKTFARIKREQEKQKSSPVVPIRKELNHGTK
jgi:hypothetical protein